MFENLRTGVPFMKRLEQLGAQIARHPISIIALALILTLSSLHFAQQIEMQGMKTENFVGKESLLYQIYDHLYVENFGTESLVILVEGDDVAEEEVLKASLRLSDHMMQVPHVLSVRSLAEIVAAAKFVSGGVREIPAQGEIDEILSRIPASSISPLMPDRRHTMISVENPVSLQEVQRKELLEELKDAVRLSDFPAGYGVTVTGNPALTNAIINQMNQSQGPIMALAGLLMVVALLLLFRHVRWPLMPIPVVFLGIVWTFGAMGLFRIPMTMVSMSAFPILIGLGIDYAIQFHNRINEEFGKDAPLENAVANTVNHVALPVLIAIAVTAAGFISLLSSTVPMIRDFGLLCIIGIIMCYLSTLFVGLTALFLMERRHPRTKSYGDKANSARGGSAVGGYLEKMADFCIHRWKEVLAAALVLSLLGNYADTLVAVETDSKNFVPQDLPPLIDYRHMNAIFGGTDTVKFLVQGDDITDPHTLKWMDEFESYLRGSRDQVHGTTSIVTFIKQANGGTLPDDATQARAIIERLPESVRNRFLSGHNIALIDVNIGEAQKNLGVEGLDRLIKELQRDLDWMTPPPGVKVTQTGDSVVMTTVIKALTTGRSEMSLLGLFLIFLILLAIYRDLIKALLPVLPMLVVIGWMGGVMYMAGIKYTPLTATLGALILGVGSEYAILMMERFYEELENVGDPFEALSITTNRIGSALMASGMTVVFGFAALTTSPFSINSNFGVVTVLAIVFAIFTTFTVFVVLMLRMEIRREVFENARAQLARALRQMRYNGHGG